MNAETLPELFASVGIRPKRFSAGPTQHVVCPKCGGGRTREVSLSVTVDEDGLGATWVCHRGKCGWTGGARIKAAPARRPLPVATVQSRPEWMWQWFAERKIGARTVEAFGCYVAVHWFPVLGRHEAIVFPYLRGGEVVNRKYRAEPGKLGMAQEKDAIPTLYNWDRAWTARELVFVEGETDVLALFECGVPNAVSLKDGAPARVSENGSDKRFEALKTHAEGLVGIKHIVLAGDMDGPGMALREELARRLGRQRCSVVNWPAGCKDAGETLMRHDADGVLEALAAATPYPIEGLLTITPDELDAIAASIPPATMTTGTAATDAILALPTEGRLIVLSGYPSHGKSNWLRWIMLHTARQHARRWAVFSPEMQPWQHYAAECAEVITGRRFWGEMTREERRQAGIFLRDSVVMLACDGTDQSPTVEWLLEIGEAAVAQRGTTDLVIDPWNEVDQTRPVNVTETEFIGAALRRFRAFAAHHGCNVWIAAHPAKPQQRDGKVGIVGAYDLAGSAYWANRSDLGLTMHSPCAGTAQLFVWKSRSKRWAKRDDFATMAFHRETGRYSDPISKWEAE